MRCGSSSACLMHICVGVDVCRQIFYSVCVFVLGMQLLTDGSLEPAPFFSLHFNLAVNVPLLLPFVLPTLVSLIRAVKFTVRK